MAPSLITNPQYRATFQCIEDSSRPGGFAVYSHLHSNNAMSPANGWKGTNRSGWSTPEMDQATDRFFGSIRESDRLAAERDMVRIVSAQLPLIPLNLSLGASFVAKGVTKL